MSKRTSAVWNCVTIEKGEDGTEGAICNKCKKKFSAKSASNIRRHINDCQDSVPSKRSRTGDEPVLLSTAEVDRFNSLLVTLFCKSLIPFFIVERPEFIEFVTALNPNYRLPTRATLAGSLLKKAYDDKKAEVLESLRKATCISLTTDCWTSVVQQGFISLTAHFIEQGRLVARYVNQL